MKYLRKFATEAEYNAYKKSPLKSYVSLVGSGVIYDKGMPEGVYVQHIDGKLYTTDEWTAGGFANDKANGVAVIASECAFVIAKSDIGASAWSSNTSNMVDGVMQTVDKPVAVTDYAGYSNTQLMLATDSSGAGYSCANYTFPNGKKGYLPALGEWNIARNNRSAIDAAMGVIGTTIQDKYYWSSTQYSSGRAWRLYWTGTYIEKDDKSTSAYYVRAFTTL